MDSVAAVVPRMPTFRTGREDMMLIGDEMRF